jgi:predicted RNA-binding Zn-ribbon protein involved in translation (DUF1610 family)
VKKNQEQDKDLPEPTIEQGPALAKPSSSKNNEPATKRGSEDEQELARREAYIDPRARDLLRKLLQAGDNAEIVPKYTPGLGFRYQTTENENATESISKEFLENLAQLDILKESFFDAVSACPNCQSPIITFHNRCPKCKSHNVNKTSLTEHIPCGYIDQKEKYKDNRCPKCGELLIEGQYRNMGRWYVCQNCGERFETPEFDLICRKCNNNFTVKEAQIVDIPKFSLNIPRKKEIRQNVSSLEGIRTVLTELGFRVEIPGISKGLKSGMQHHFSLIATKQINQQEVIVALDHAVSESEVQTSPLILYIYKTSEVKVDIPVFVAIPRLSDTAKKIAQGHDILLIEGTLEEKETIERVKKALKDRLNLITKKTAPSELSAQQQQEKTLPASILTFLGLKKKGDSQTSQPPNWQPVIDLSRRTLSSAIIFNSLLCIFYSLGLLAGIINEHWQVFEPYFVNGSLFWVVIAVSILNMLLAMKITLIKRSYNFIYGIIIAAISGIFLLTVKQLSIVSIFTSNTTDLTTNIGRFFLLSGFALFFIEIPSILRMLGLSSKAPPTETPSLPKNKPARLILFALQIILGIVALYMAFAILIYIGQYPLTNTVSNVILIYALMLTSFISIGATVLSTWLK